VVDIPGNGKVTAGVLAIALSAMLVGWRVMVKIGPALTAIWHFLTKPSRNETKITGLREEAERQRHEQKERWAASDRRFDRMEAKADNVSVRLDVHNEQAMKRAQAAMERHSEIMRELGYLRGQRNGREAGGRREGD
jgi:hypothetical protein